MKIKTKLEIKYNSEEFAEISYETLKIDNECFIKTEKSKNIVTFTINSDTLGSFLNTADDLISSEIVIENIIQSTLNKK